MHDSLPSFHIIPVGWDHSAWKGYFYPDDLPMEWRLTYFANEFPAVVITSDLLKETVTEKMPSWADDVSEDFRFYLQISEALGPLIDDESISAMGDHLGGLIVSPDLLVHAAGREIPFDFKRGIKLYGQMEVNIQSPPTMIPDKTGMGLALWITNEELGGLPTQRSFLEQVRDQLYEDAEILICLAHPSISIKSLRDFRQLAQLMGLA